MKNIKKYEDYDLIYNQKYNIGDYIKIDDIWIPYRYNKDNKFYNIFIVSKIDTRQDTNLPYYLLPYKDDEIGVWFDGKHSELLSEYELAVIKYNL
jgi:hypothetical protein